MVYGKLDPATHRKTEKERQVTDGRGGRGCMGEEPNYTAERKPCFYKWFNTL
jgi:hypothetical protein